MLTIWHLFMSGIPACRVKRVYSFSPVPLSSSTGGFWRAQALHAHHVWSAHLCCENIPGPLGLWDLLWPNRHSCVDDHSQMGERRGNSCRWCSSAGLGFRNTVSWSQTLWDFVQSGLRMKMRNRMNMNWAVGTFMAMYRITSELKCTKCAENTSFILPVTKDERKEGPLSREECVHSTGGTRVLLWGTCVDASLLFWGN